MTNMYDFAYPSTGGLITIFGEVHPSGILSASSGKVVTERAFIVPCAFAQQFALRMIGKWYDAAYEWIYPFLPAPYPKSDESQEPHYTQRMNLVATTWSIEPLSACCFNNSKVKILGEDLVFACSGPIVNPTSIIEAARYYGLHLVAIETENPDPEQEPTVTYEMQLPANPGSDTSCLCVVRIQYQEPPWHCENRPNSENNYAIADLLGNTAIAVHRTPAYEMYTLPNRNLIWIDAVAQTKEFKGDNYATITVPRTDIAVYWYNVPVSRLCEIESHLATYRNTVNDVEYTLLKDCICADYECLESDDTGFETGDDQCQYKAETLLFVDWKEQESDRTNAYGKMNTTTLVLHFKHRFIPTLLSEDGKQIVKFAGWNHLICDRANPTGGGDSESVWQRVGVSVGANTEDLFKRKSFEKILKVD